ncbi:YmaF family protein [Clostridium beijerinckii]|uniref:YmaF family protein n=1 Tax=Clostridium beijerinckii TaxID=1520 RepID=UPI000809F2EC|nr:YmaF family protein [Clostridium beijerinckii]OCB00689.1 hypothetical protein BGS1_15525 [Clostridium beijerinckii]
MRYNCNNNGRCSCGYKNNQNDKNEDNCNYVDISYRIKNHNHEYLSSTDYAKDNECVRHNHRIAGMTGPAIECGNSHVHKIEGRTDTFCDHYHDLCDTTGPAIYLPDGKHIHLVKGKTACADGHYHDYYFTTLVEDPTNVPKYKDC